MHCEVNGRGSTSSDLTMSFFCSEVTMDRNATVLLICGIYFVIIIAVGIFASRKNKKTSDFLVAGRALGAGLIAIMLTSVQIGVGIVLGGTHNGYTDGVWYGMYYALGCGGGLILAGLLTARKLRNKEGYVPIDYFASRYGESRGIRFWAWLSNVPSMLGIFIAQVLACASILSGFGMTFGQGVVATAAGIILYVLVGGRLGIAYTNTIQVTIISIGIPLLFGTMLTNYTGAGGTLSEIYLTPFIPDGKFTRFIYLTLPFFLSISVSYDAYSCIQSAKNFRAAQVGAILGGIFVIIIGIMCSSIGVMAAKLFPGLQSGVFTVATTSVLDPVSAGVVIAAIMAAAMSSANGMLLCLGSSFSRDLYNKFLHPEVENLDDLPRSKAISMLSILVCGGIGVLFAFVMTDILDAMIIFNYPYMGSLMIPLLGGLLWDGATRKGAFAAAISGGVVGVLAFLMGIPGPLQNLLNTDLALLVAYAVSGTVLYVVSVHDTAGQKLRQPAS